MKPKARIAMTGGEGAVGRALQKVLALEGVPFRALVSSEPPIEHSRIGEHVVGEETEAAVVDRLLDGVEALVHLGPVSVTPDDDFHQQDLAGRASLIPMAGERGIAFHLVSSSEVFTPPADPSTEAVDESATVRPSTLFGVSKAAWEQTLGVWSQQKGLRCVLYRLPFVVAEYLSYTSRSARYLRAGFRKGSITPKAQEGECWGVSFVHAEDVAKVLVRTIGQERAYGQVYHLSADKWIPEAELAEMSYRVLRDFMIPCKWAPPSSKTPAGLVNRVWLDNRKAVGELGLDVSNSGIRLMQKLRMWVDDFGSTAHLPAAR